MAMNFQPLPSPGLGASGGAELPVPRANFPLGHGPFGLGRRKRMPGKGYHAFQWVIPATVALRPPEIGALGVGHRQQSHLDHVIGYAEQFGRRLFVLQVQGSQRRSQPPGAQRQLKVPDGRKDRPEHAAQCNHGRVRWRTPRQARDDVHGHLMQVFHQVHRRFEDAPGLPVGRILNGARQVGFGALSIEVGERPALVGIVYHDPPPALRIGAGGRLYGEFQAFVDDCSGHGFVQVQTLANARGWWRAARPSWRYRIPSRFLAVDSRPELWGRRLVTATQSHACQPHDLLFGMPFRCPDSCSM